MSGFFGCVSRRECVSDVFYGTDYHSHLGTKRAGMAFYNGKKFVRSIHSLENGYFRNKFEDELHKFEDSQMGVGVISDCESQPITITSHLGRYAVVTVARIENIEELTEKMLSKRMHFAELSSSDINATELVAMLIGMGDSIKEGIEYAQSCIKGSCSMLVLTDHAIYAARDKFGRTPISIGKDDKGYVCASESSSYTNLGYTYVRDLGPGEIVQMSADGVIEVTPPGCRKQICSFLWVYYGYPSAWYEGINVEDARYVNGAAMAKHDADLEIDYAAGIPDSGIGHAIGYANEKFTRGQKVVFMDDSIVRGTQLKDNIVKLYDTGIEEVHMRIACPPIIFPCKFLNFSTSRNSYDLYTRRIIRDMEGTDNISDDIYMKYVDPDGEKHKEMVDVMRKHLQLTSLKFQRLEDLVAAIGLPKCELCTHCWDNSSYTE